MHGELFWRNEQELSALRAAGADGEGMTMMLWNILGS